MAKQLKYCLRFNWNNYKRNSDIGVHILQWYEFETVSDLLQWFILYYGTHTRVKQRQEFVCIFPFRKIFGEWWIVTSLADINTFDYVGNFSVNLEIRWLLRNHFFTSLHSTYDTAYALFCFHFHFHFQDQSSIDCMFAIRMYEQFTTRLTIA